MRFLKISMISICMVALCFSVVSAAETGWKKIGAKNGIVGYTRPTPKSSVDEMKGIGMVDVPIAAIEAVIRDVSAQTIYMYRCSEASIINTPELKSTTDTVYFYNVTDMPYPASDRDVIVKSTYSVDKASGVIYIKLEGVKTSYKSDPKKVRMPVMEGGYILTPKGPDKTEINYMAIGDPGGNLPSFVVNMLTKNLSIETIANIREMVKKDKYKSSKTVVTTTPH